MAEAIASTAYSAAGIHRAYALMEIKAVDDERGIITGLATTPTTDRYGDIVEPAGAVFKLPIPLLWQHSSGSPIGHVTQAKVTKAGIEIVAQVARGVLDEIDRAWTLIKSGLVRGLSIGFRALDSEQIPNSYGLIFNKWEWLELSAVTIPANAEATIQTVKSIATTEQRAASGNALPVGNSPAGVSAFQTTPIIKVKPKMPQTFGEQIATYEASLHAKSLRMAELMNGSSERGGTLNEAEAEEYEACSADQKAYEEHLVRLRNMEKVNLKTAKPVEVKDAESGSRVRGGSVPAIVRATSLPKGTAFARYAMALAASKGNLVGAAALAERWRDSTPEVPDVLKAAVSAGTTTDTTWAAPLVNYQVMTEEFIEYLRPMTLIGRINGFRRVPFNVRVPAQTSGSTAYWVGEGQVKPLSALAFNTVTLTYSKIAAIVVMTDELVRFSNPSAEGIVRQDLAATIAAKLDRDFIDPTVAVTGSSPASITNGVTPVTATGTTPDNLRTDIKTLLQSFAGANLSLAGAVWVMTQQQAIAISLMRNSLGQPEFPGVTFEGGTLAGIPVVATEAVPGTGGSPTDGTLIVLMLPGQILLADDGQVTLDASREASLQMDSAPDSPPSASTVPVSMFQQNMVAIRAERYINWVKARSTAVAFIQNAKYSDS